MQVKNLYPKIFRFKMYGIRLGLMMVLLISTGQKTHGQSYYIRTIAGTGVAGYSGDGGPATLAKFNGTEKVAFDDSGNMYIPDGNLVVRKINRAGVISTFAGNGISGHSGDGGLATSAEFQYPSSVAADHSGNIYIDDYTSDMIRKVSGGIITTIAGTYDSFRYNGDGIPATSAFLFTPYDIACDDSGNLYIADVNHLIVRKIQATDGYIHIVAGIYTSYGYSGDGGPATSAEIGFPTSVAVDHFGNLYIANYEYNAVRKVTAATGVITTIAGDNGAGYSGDGGPATAAELYHPRKISVDNEGNVYIADHGNNVIRKIVASTGYIYTIAGNGTAGYAGDGGPATEAELYEPENAMADTFGNVFICDGNNVIRELIPDYGIFFKYGPSLSLSLCENTDAFIDTLLSVTNLSAGTNTWSSFSGPLHGTISASYTMAADSGINTPSGLHYVPATGYSGPDTFVVQAANAFQKVYMTIYVTVKPGATAAPITGADTICVYTSELLSDTTLGGTWQASNHHVSIDSTGLAIANTSGRDTISYTVINTCGYNTLTKTITVDTLPYTAPIIGDTNICPGALGTFVDAAGGGVWSTSNGHASVLGGYSFGVVSALTSGIDTLLYTVANSCGTAVASKTIVIDSLPAVAAITGVSSLCTGDSILLTDASTGGVWSSANGNATVANGVVHGVVGGTDVIEYSIAGTCGTTSASKIITIQPYAGSISGPATLCAGLPVAFSDAADFGNWSVADTGSASITTGGVLIGMAAGNDTVIYTITNSCGTASVSTPIHIIAAPDAGTITGDSTVCAGSAIILRDTVAGGHWKGTGDSAVVADGIVAGVVPGRDTITYAVTTTCGTATTSFIVTVLPESDCISLVPNLSDSAFKIYPDPSTGIFTVEVPGGNAVVSVIDIVGKVVADQTISGNNATIDMSKLPLGDYIIKAVANDIIYRGKIIINR